MNKLIFDTWLSTTHLFIWSVGPSFALRSCGPRRWDEPTWIGVLSKGDERVAQNLENESNRKESQPNQSFISNLTKPKRKLFDDSKSDSC